MGAGHSVDSKNSKIDNEKFSGYGIEQYNKKMSWNHRKGKTLAKASVSAARAAASKTATERPLTTDVDIQEQITHPPPHVIRKHIWEDTERRNSSGKNIREQIALEESDDELDFEPILEAYEKEFQESEGFDIVGDYSVLEDAGFSGLIGQPNLSKELAEECNGPVKSALELYNQKMGAKFKLVEIEKANWQPPFTDLITFTAVEDESDEPKVFQAALENSFPIESEPTVTLCRQKGKRLEGYRTDDYYMDYKYKSGQPSSQ